MSNGTVNDLGELHGLLARTWLKTLSQVRLPLHISMWQGSSSEITILSALVLITRI